MKKYLNYSFLAAIAATMTLFTSCSKDDGVEAYVPEPVQFSVGVGNLSVSGGTRTQASDTETAWTSSIDGKFAVNDIVHIWTTDADGHYYRKAYKVSAAAANAADPNTLTANDAGATGSFYWGNKTEYKPYEIYSFGKAAVGDSTNTTAAQTPDDVRKSYFCEVPADQTAVANAIEFMFGYGTLYYGTSAKALKVSHQLARIDVKLVTKKNNVAVDKNTSGTSITSMPALTSETFSLTIGWNTMHRKGLFSAPNYTAISTGAADDIKGETANTGTWAAAATPVQGTITPRVLKAQCYNETNENFETTYSAVVIPQSFQNKDMFTVEYDGATYIYHTPDSEFNIEAGKHYIYTVTIEDSSISVTVAIQNWTQVDNSGSPVEAVLQ